MFPDAEGEAGAGYVPSLYQLEQVVAVGRGGQGNFVPEPTTASQRTDEPAEALAELRELLGKGGGRQEARTPDLRVANAALSQLS